MSSQLAKNTAYLTLASVGQKIIAFVYFLFLARVMQPESTGTYFLVVSVAMIFSVIADFGITPVVIREIAKHPDQTRQIFSKSLVAKIPLFFIGYLGTVLAAVFLGYSREIVWLTALSGLSLVLDSVHLLFYGVLRGHQKLQFEAIGMFGGQIAVAFFGGLSLWLYPSLPLLITALVVGSAFNVMVSTVVLIKRFGHAFFLPSLDREFLKSLFVMAFPFALSAIFIKVYSYVDTLFISKLLDATAVGLYSIAYKLTYAFQFLPLAFTAALYPSFSATIKEHPEKLGELLFRSFWYMLILATPIVFGLNLIAGPAVLLAGQSYNDAAPILGVLVFVLIPIFLDFPIGALLNAAGRQATKTAIMGITMLINVVLNAILIPVVGVMGAAYAALAGFSFMFLAGLYFVPQIADRFPVKRAFKDLFAIGFSGLVMFVVGQFLLARTHWVLIIPICALVYALFLVLTHALTKKDFQNAKRLMRV